MQSRLVFVLVGTRSPGNLGAVCRLAKAFGFPEVRLVAPRFTAPESEAAPLAHGAEDVLAAVRTFPRLADALRGCFRSIATTARGRDWSRVVSDPAEWADRLADHDETAGPYALVLGPEDRGLSNEDLAACDEVVSIPVPSDSGASLSLPAAASILAFLASRSLRSVPPAGRSARSDRNDRALSASELDSLLAKIETALCEIGFRPRPSAVRFRGSLRDFLARARPTIADRSILQHMVAQVGKWRRRWTGREAHAEKSKDAIRS